MILRGDVATISTSAASEHLIAESVESPKSEKSEKKVIGATYINGNLITLKLYRKYHF